jgi:hypothetical protein
VESPSDNLNGPAWISTRVDALRRQCC